MRSFLNAVSALSLAAWMTACANALAVDNPGRVSADALNDPAMASVLEATAIQNFQCAFASYVTTAGVMSGEYFISNNLVASNLWGWRGVEILTAPGACATTRTPTDLGFYSPLQTARFTAEDAAARLGTMTDAQVPGRTRILAEMAVYGGWSYLLLGEGMCSMTVNGGPMITRAQTFQLAETGFTGALALAQAAGDNDLLLFSLAGRARARLDLGNLPGAAADAALVVPVGWVRNAEYSESRPSRENRLYNMTIRNDYLTVAPDYRGLTVGGVADPRVKVLSTGRKGQDALTPQFSQQKFLGSGAVNLPIASWKESQLIYAEAVGGQAAKDAINAVRTAAGVAKLDGSEGNDINVIVLEERRRALFSEGQRYGDMLRKNLPFPTGVNAKQQTYGPTTCVPLPNIETQNNPNLQGK
jgi:hypothetical protein